jgi:hypothetical protein
MIVWPFKKEKKYQIFFECEYWAIRKYETIQHIKTQWQNLAILVSDRLAGLRHTM